MAEAMIAHLTKVCNRCGAEKPLTAEFYFRNAAVKSGFCGRCKMCMKSYNDARYIRCGDRLRSLAAQKARDNKTAISNRRKVLRQENLDAERKAERDWYARNREKILRCKAEYRERTRDALRARLREQYADNPERFRAYVRKWRELNPGKYQESYRKSARKVQKRIRAEGGARLLRSRISIAVRKSLLRTLAGGKCGRSWQLLVGYTANDLIEHLQRLFSDGMTLEHLARGEIHVDHIRPVSSFNITGPDCPEFRACWALNNLQPLWAADNLRKGAKWTTPDPG